VLLKIPVKSLFMSPIKNDARIDVMNRYKSKSESPFPIAGSEKTKVYINFWRPLNCLNILSNLVILSTLKILAICGRVESEAFCSLLAPAISSMMSKIEALTTKKSKTFQVDKK